MSGCDAQQLSATAREREGELLRKRVFDCGALYRDTQRDYADLVDIAMRPYRGQSVDKSL